MSMFQSTGCPASSGGSASVNLALALTAPITDCDISRVTLTPNKLQEWLDTSAFGIAQTGPRTWEPITNLTSKPHVPLALDSVPSLRTLLSTSCGPHETVVGKAVRASQDLENVFPDIYRVWAIPSETWETMQKTEGTHDPALDQLIKSHLATYDP